MITSYSGYNLHHSLSEVSHHPDRFEHVEPSEIVSQRTGSAFEPYEPLVVFGSHWDGSGLAAEMFVNTEQIPITTKSMSILTNAINVGLGNLAHIKHGSRSEFGDMREMALKKCQTAHYQVLAGVAFGRSRDDASVNYYFYAKPLEEAIFVIREQALTGSVDEAENDEVQDEDSDMSLDEGVAKIELSVINPDAYTRRMTGLVMGSLLLPEAIGEPIDPI